QMDQLVKRSDIGGPVAERLQSVLGEERQQFFLGDLDVLRRTAEDQGVGAKFVDHRASLLCAVIAYISVVGSGRGRRAMSWPRSNLRAQAHTRDRPASAA